MMPFQGGIQWFEGVRYSPEIPSDAVRKSAIQFDQYHECIWTGNEEGRVSSYLSPDLDRYTSFRSHEMNIPVRQLMTSYESGILSLGMNGLRLTSRNGIVLWTFQNEKTINLHCMINLQNGPLLLAGEQDTMEMIDFYSGQSIGSVSATEGYDGMGQGHLSGTVVMRRHRLLCCGQMDGSIVFRDPASLRIEHHFQAHSGALSDAVISNHTLLTCGFSHRAGQLIQDPILRAFDLRMNKALAPITFPQGAYMLQPHPKISNVVYVLSQSGHLQSCDLGTLMVEPRFYQIDTMDYNYCSSFDISSTGDAMVFALGSGSIHLWLNNEEFAINSFSQPLQMAPKKPPKPPVEIMNDETPLSVIGMPFYSEPLLSNFPSDMPCQVGRPPALIPPEIMASIKHSSSNRNREKSNNNNNNNNFTSKNEAFIFVKNPGLFKRNQQGYRRQSDSRDEVPKFRSEQEREDDLLARTANSAGNNLRLSDYESDQSTADEAAAAAALARARKREARRKEPSTFSISMPKCYRKVEIKYSRFGVEDFDFAFYNKTRFGGLETHIANSYCNSVLQMWNFCLPLKKMVMKHLYCGVTRDGSNLTPCNKKLCLTCELGFLFKMLDDSKGVNCHSSNFLRVLRLNGRARELGILETENGIPFQSFGKIIQIFHSFLLTMVDEEIVQASLPSSSLPSPSGNEMNSTSFIVGGGFSHLSTPPITASPLHQMVSLCSDHTSWCSCGSFERSTLYRPFINLNYSTPLPATTVGSNGRRKSSLSSRRLKFVQLLASSFLISKGNNNSSSSSTSPSSSSSLSSTAVIRCKSCNRTGAFKSTRQELIYLPPVLNIHCNLESEEDLSYWKVGGGGGGADDFSSSSPNAAPSNSTPASGEDLIRSSWLPFRISIGTSKNPITGEQSIHVEEMSPDPLELARRSFDENCVIYDLTATVIQVLDDFFKPQPQAKKSHFVSLIRFPLEGLTDMLMGSGLESPESPGLMNQPFKWILFNDFLVTPRPAFEAVHYNCVWKVPTLLQYTRVDVDKILNEHWLKRSPLDLHLLIPQDIPGQVFKRYHLSYLICYNNRRVKSKVRFFPLTEDELREIERSQTGYLCSLDAEFVMINAEETEVRSDGTKSIVRPSRQALARLTLIRGEDSPQFPAGTPFLDEYIEVEEPIHDYLSLYSGIREGDLERDRSEHYVTDLKSCYKKLRILIDQGCKFIGHGLKNDFRTINLVINPGQVIDTVNLYHIPKQRNISLRFLSWYLFRSVIQTGSHCSIEDSRMALAAYQHYKKIIDEVGEGSDGIDGDVKFRKLVEDIYAMGRRLNWTIPASK